MDKIYYTAPGYYYVKSGGTATGDGGRTETQRTGLWNTTLTEFYDAIIDAVGATTVPGDDDFILCSDLHNSSAAHAAFTLNDGGSESGAGLQIISVDNANQENYKPGATDITTTGFAAYRWNNNVLVAGLTIGTNAIAAFLTIGTPRVLRLIDTKTTIDDEGIICNLDGASVFATNCNFGDCAIEAGGYFHWRGGTWIGPAADPLIESTALSVKALFVM